MTTKHSQPDEADPFADEEIGHCTSCGEAELVGARNADGEAAEFGWFTDTAWETICQRCGTVQP